MPILLNMLFTLLLHYIYFIRKHIKFKLLHNLIFLLDLFSIIMHYIQMLLVYLQNIYHTYFYLIYFMESKDMFILFIN